MEKPTYSSNDVQAILGRALEQQRVHGEGELSYEELVSIGRDVGLSEQAIAAAARQHESEGELDAELARRLRKERRGFLSHAATFVIINAFLMIMNLASGGPLWSFWPIFGWGLGLALHLLSVALPNRERMREKARASLLRRRRDEDKRREKVAKREQKERERFRPSSRTRTASSAPSKSASPRPWPTSPTASKGPGQPLRRARRASPTRGPEPASSPRANPAGTTPTKRPRPSCTRPSGDAARVSRA
ncbi:MAG: 2TM domain-containing protein [Polyangiaceae bacterium]|nr:2TM domain-containing protein [Polyangiaceae bacterium]